MSLLSDFGDNGFVGGVDCGMQFLRMQCITAPPVFSACWRGSFDFKNTGSYIVQYADTQPAATTGTIPVHKFDFENKTSILYTGQNRSAASNNGRNIVANPITGFWMIFNPGFASVKFYQTLDGTNYTLTDNDNILGAWYGGAFSPAYYDGTTFAYIDVNNRFVYTTNGTTWTTGGAIASMQPFFPKNNYSFYSGYWFHVSSVGYGYRTSVTGSSTNVAGYVLTSISPNGRYVMRRNTTSRAEEYSTDGGASWSSFPSTPFAQSGGEYSAHIASDSGQFFCMSYYGVYVWCYDFSSSVWRPCAAFNSLSSSSYIETAIPVNIQGVEVLHIYLGGSQNTYIMDMPKGLI